ncbi:MAG: hypothetical protein OI715_00175 (plasmid) [Candidatus Methanoperedens sp.]|nr:MAG: hypothetical protein OI715_00175 [Candidatus Methanoperedens sp.]
MENISETLTGVANLKEQVLYSLLYVIAALGMVVMGAPGYVAFLLIFGVALYNVSKFGKTREWFEENSKTDWIIGIGYLVFVGAGVIVGLLYTFRIV